MIKNLGFSRNDYDAYLPLVDKELLIPMKKQVTCCFSGHRPSKLSEDHIMRIKSALSKQIDHAVKNGYWYFIAGGSTGMDTWAAECVIQKRKNQEEIFLEIAVPCVNQSELWTGNEREKYNDLLGKADKVTYVTDKMYEKSCMRLRNKYMVSCSSLLICAYTGIAGGTKNTVDFAKNSGIEIINLL